MWPKIIWGKYNVKLFIFSHRPNTGSQVRITVYVYIWDFKIKIKYWNFVDTSVQNYLTIKHSGNQVTNLATWCSKCIQIVLRANYHKLCPGWKNKVINSKKFRKRIGALGHGVFIQMRQTLENRLTNLLMDCIVFTIIIFSRPQFILVICNYTGTQDYKSYAFPFINNIYV